MSAHEYRPMVDGELSATLVFRYELSPQRKRRCVSCAFLAPGPETLDATGAVMYRDCAAIQVRVHAPSNCRCPLYKPNGDEAPPPEPPSREIPDGFSPARALREEIEKYGARIERRGPDDDPPYPSLVGDNLASGPDRHVEAALVEAVALSTTDKHARVLVKIAGAWRVAISAGPVEPARRIRDEAAAAWFVNAPEVNDAESGS